MTKKQFNSAYINLFLLNLELLKQKNNVLNKDQLEEHQSEPGSWAFQGY